MSALSFEEFKKLKREEEAASQQESSEGQQSGSTSSSAQDSSTTYGIITFEEFKQAINNGASYEDILNHGRQHPAFSETGTADKKPASDAYAQKQEISNNNRRITFEEFKQAIRNGASYEDILFQGRQQPSAAETREDVKTAAQKKRWEERRSELQSELDTWWNSSGWEIDEAQANEREARRRNILKELEDLDEKLYLADHPDDQQLSGYSSKDYEGAAGRLKNIFGSASSSYFAGMTNEAGTTLAALREDADTNEYAGWATDDISARAIGYEHDENKLGDYEWMKPLSEKLEASADMLGEDAAEDLERAKNGLSNLGQAGVDIAVNVIQMGYDFGLGSLTGGSSLIPMFARSAGSASQEARHAGANIDQQFVYGTISGGIEVLTEKMFDGVAKIYGAGAADEAVEEVIRRLSKSNFGRSALRWASGALGEGIEEVISDILAPYAETVYNGESVSDTFKNTFSGTYTLSEIIYDFLIGAAIGGLGGGLGAVNGQYAAANEALLMADAGLGSVDSQVNDAFDVLTGRVTPEKAQAREQAARALLTPDALRSRAESQPGTEQSDETGRELINQTINNLDLTEGQKEVLSSGFETGEADAQTYAHGIQEAVQLGRSGVSYEQAREDAVFGKDLNDAQFRHAWEIGMQKAGRSTETVRAEASPAVPEYESVEEFSSEFKSPDKVTEIFDQAADTDVNDFAAGFRAAYDMGQSGVSANYLTQSSAAQTITPEQAQAAYELGRADAAASASERAGKIAAQQKTGSLARVKGTVKGEGVTIADMKKAFNDSQNTAYRLLTRYAEATGVNIVLYNSQADAESGQFPAQQGRFQWKDNTIYIDINSGLNGISDVKDLGKYTVLRTFAHEFTHFIEKYNAAEYNEFREFVFSTLEAKGENVHDLIEDMQRRDGSGSMSYEQASREVVADAMMDILPDSTLVQQLASEHQSVFKKLLQRMRDFTARMKQYYREISTKAPREAEALKENGAYMESIVQMWDKIAKGAVENYQGANGEAILDQPAKPDNLPKRSKPKQAAKQVKQVEASAEAAQEAAEAQEAPAEPETPAAQEQPAQEPESVSAAAEEAVTTEGTPEGAKLRARLEAGNGPVTMNGYEYAVTGWNDTTIDIRNGRTSRGTTYTATVRRVNTSGAVPVYEGRELFNGKFQFKDDAIDALVQVAENNNLLKEVPTDESTEKTQSEAPDLRGETGDRRNGAGAVRVSSELQDRSVQGHAAGRQSDSVPSEEGAGAGRHGDRPDAERDGRSGSEGSSPRGVQPGRGEQITEADAQPEAAAPMTDEDHERQTEELHEITTQQVEEKSTEAAGGNNYQIGESLDLPNGSKARFHSNVDAIRLVKQLEAEGRNATAEEQAILARYVGWGGISEAFDERKSDWSKEYAELKELLTEEEYKAAKGSTLNAHYTSIPVIRAMYRGLDKLGFRGGRMLEPSSGVGNFVGAMPAEMSAKVKSWTMIELDNITGLIAKHLYPRNDVRIEGFEKAILPDNYMDVAIGNVPFGNYPVVDRAYPKKLTSAIHNYFFAKSLNKVRPGGIVMFITSSYTMNANDQTVRKYISKQADLLGAIRLPNTAFSGNSGTSVVTDILVLKKRAPGTEYAGVPFLETPYDYKFGYQNEYFKAHPEMVLGEEVSTRGMHYNNEYTVNPYTDRGSLEEQIDKAFEGIEVVGSMDYPAQESPEKANFKAQRAEKGTKQGGFVQKDGKIYRNDGGELKEVNTDEKTAKRITGMLGIRDWARQLMNAQQQGASEASIKALRRSLNKAYDSFVKENGFLNSPANRKAFADDPDRFSLYALENWDSEKKTATKADIFKVDTIRPNTTITHADSVKDALTVSRNTTGGVDVQLISRLTGRSTDDVTREMIESELAFKNRAGQLEPAETYLSGNVRAKLRDAQGLVGIDKDYQHNVDALKAILPADIPHEQIFVQPGSPWIPESVYSDFAAYILGGNNHRYYGGPDIEIHRSNQTGTFTIDLNNKRLKANYQNNQEWGTPKRSFLNLLEAMMNSRSVTVTYKDTEGHTIVDRVATDAANEKIEQITRKFQEWLWEDEERTKDLEYLYNETFNNLVNPKYDGSALTVNGLRAGWSLKPHQADAVQRIISCGGNTLLAHRVGAGKTMEMAAAAMKLKELGIVKKPMFCVPKSLVAQWGKEFTSYFPAAKLLVAEQGDFTPGNRKTFANRIATGNYDAIIVSYEQFEKIPISDDFALQLYQEQIDEIIQAINEAKEEAGAKSMSVKDMEKKRKQLEAKMQKLSDKAKDADNIEFEQLGIDSIFVDEAHNFKNLFYTTSMNNVSGLGNRDGSKRAFDLYTKVRYLQQLNGGRGVVFATATPVMNSMSEMYIMQKYLQSDLLDQLGLSTFDAWAKQFGEVVNGVEIKPSGQGYRVKQSFSRFKNMNELQLLFRNFADVLTKVPGLPIPKMKGGAVKVIECDAGEFQQEYMKLLEKRADNIKNVDPSEDNMLKITSDGRKISYTQRMIDPSLPYEEGCKIYRCADNILQEYRESKDIKGTQIVFCDMATPKGKSNSAKAAVEEDAEMDTESAQLYTDLKKRLVKLGIPAKEIAFIHDADTDAKKSKLFDDVNDGRVRVLIGSTGKMGVGMNAQKRIVAIHHLDVPWRPGDVEQRDGRAFRQKNINEEVSKYVYVTKGSFDARLWDIIDRKSSFIDQIMNGENVGREVEDTGEVTLSAAEVKALASGNPLIEEQVKLQNDIRKLENLYMAHRASVVEARRKLQEAKQAKAEAESRAESARKDAKRRTEASTDEHFAMTVGNKTYTDRKEVGKVLMAHASAKATEDEYTKIGSFAGFDILVMQTKEGVIGLLKGESGHRFNTYPDNTTLMVTNMQKVLNGLEKTAQISEEYAKQKAQEIKAQEAMMQAPFPRQEELDQKRARFNEVMDILNPKEEQTIAESDDEETTEYSIRRTQNIPYDTQIDAMFGKSSTKLGRVDDIYVHGSIMTGAKTGLDGKPFFMLKRNFDKSTRTEANNEHYSAHSIDEEIMRAIPGILERPALYVVGNGRVSVIANEYVKTQKSEAAPLLIGINPNASVDGRTANEIKSVYGRDGFTEWIRQRARDSKIYAGDENKAAALLRDVGLKLSEPVAYAADLTERILSAPVDNVKPEIRIKQEFSSAATSLNQVAALFKSKYFDPGDINIDIGGGAYNATTEYLADKYGTTNMVFDPYNRGSEENLATLDFLRAGNRADTATCANVLNVIKEQEARRNVILEVAKAIKEDGTAYFSVYEKDKSGQGRQTGADQWQNSRATADYVHEIEEFFDNVERKGAVIIATDPKADLPAAFWRITENEEIEYSTRRDNALSNREILSMAAHEIDVENLTDVEKNALDIFRDRLTRLQEAQEKRADLGRQYKEQQFTKGGSRQEAARIYAAMQVLDTKIKSLENGLLSLENKDVLKSVLEKARGVVEQEERKRGDENLKRYRERRNESAAARKYRERVRMTAETLRKWLVSPSNKDIRKHVPAEIQKTVADFLDSINFMSKTALRTSGLDTTKADEKYLKNMKRLRDAIKSNVNGNELYRNAYFNDEFMENFEALIRKAEAHMSENSGVFVVNQMSAKELRELSHTLKTLKKIITTMNEFHNNAVFQHAYDAGEESIDYLSKFERSKKSGTIYKFFSFDYMRPSYAFERFGKGGQSIEHEFREGQATQAKLAHKIIDFAKRTYTAKEVKEWGDTVKSFELSDGETVKIPVTHIMSLYCLNKRAQALTHIYGDGIRVANYQNGRSMELDEGHLVTLGDVQKMISSLTPRQIEVANALQRYMSTDTAAWGNYVSMARFDVEQFTEENYFPINSDGRYLPATADETPDSAGLYALLNMGFTKELKENADNRIILYNIFDVFANHTAQMTQYRSFALPVLDALKWFNYQNDSTSVRTKLSSAFGAPADERAGSGSKGYAEQFVINLLRAYNGTAAQGDPYDSLGMKGLHRFNRAQIAFNLRVVAQQPMAITRAAMILPPAKLAKGLGMSAAQMKRLAAEMEEYSGIAAWKALGFYDTNISRGLTELIKQNPSFMDRVTEVGTKGAEVADRFTWAAMWYAAKDSVKRSDYSTHEAYMQAVTELFEDVIYKTQVVDSVLTKSEFMRAKGFFPRMLGSFMSEPMTTTSMLTSAYYKFSDDVQRGLSRSEAWKKNGSLFAKTAAVYTIGQVMLAAAQAVMDAWRDDDEYDAENWLNNFFQKYLNAFKSNAVEEFLFFGKVPILSELYEALKSLLDYAGVFEKLGLDLYGNDISNGWAQYAKYLKKGFEITIDLIQGNKTNYTAYGAIYNFLRGAAGATGFPIATAWRELQDMWNNTVGYFAPGYKLTTYERAIDRTYNEQIRPTGLSQKAFEKILADADARGDGNGSLKQDELGAELVAAIERGDISEEQADAIWRTKWNKANSTTFDTWRSKNGGGSSAASAARQVSTSPVSTASTPAAAEEITLPGWMEKDEFIINASATQLREFKEFYAATGNLYGQIDVYKSWTQYAKPEGVSLELMAQAIMGAKGDDTSVNQNELGAYCRDQVKKGRMSEKQANAMFLVFWHGSRSTTYSKWAERHDKLDQVLADTSMSEQQYKAFLDEADRDGNGKLIQDELGYALRNAVYYGELTNAQAAAIWDAQGWKHNYAAWLTNH